MLYYWNTAPICGITHYLGVGIASSSAGSTIASRTRSRKYIRKEDSQDLGNQVFVAVFILYTISISVGNGGLIYVASQLGE